MIPDFDEYGFLPEGVWETDLAQFAKRFAVFRRSDRRFVLFEKLEKLLKETLATGWIQEIIIDGSFVTEKDEPNDIDIILVIRFEVRHLQPPFWIERALNQNRLRKTYKFDVFVETEGSIDYQERIDFFQKIKHSDERKGVVRLKQ